MKGETFVKQYLTLKSTTSNKPGSKKKYCFKAANMIRHYAIKKKEIFSMKWKKGFV